MSHASKAIDDFAKTGSNLSESLRRVRTRDMFKMWRDRSTDAVYDIEEHVRMAEDLDAGRDGL